MIAVISTRTGENTSFGTVVFHCNKKDVTKRIGTKKDCYKDKLPSAVTKKVVKKGLVQDYKRSLL